jgi:uncharacterized protein YjbJ (UPF0337 family)
MHPATGLQFAKKSSVHNWGQKTRNAENLDFLGIYAWAAARHAICNGRIRRCGSLIEQRNKSTNHIHMSTLVAIGNWNIAKGKLKQKLSQLTADDEQFAAGKQDELTGRIQKRTAQTRKKNEQPAEGCCGCQH